MSEKPEPYCQDCKQGHIMICLDGVRWLCWRCYCEEMARRMQAPPR